MKKILSFLLCAVMLVSVLTACGGNNNEDNAPATLKFGAGVYATLNTKDATDDANGSGTLDAALAAVLVNADGKIAACELDAMKMETKFSTDGKVTAVADKDLKTKYEQGNDYGMSGIGKKEWFEQADALEKVVVGKTIDEVKALVVNNYAGNDEVIAAGCTIGINELILAVDKAVANAKTDVSKDAKLRVTGAGQQTAADATEDKDASNKLTANLFAAAVDASGKVLAASSDCVETTFTLKDGKVSKNNADNRSKRQLGADYGMKSDYGSKREWFEHADAFDAACVGKTGAEIAGLMAADYKGVDSLQAAGCTIYVSGFVAAASKI
ncbi:MAG: hypothetical protein IJN04_02195 [Clostridia bacterium]|nr:hypothetical protein [Clostridia bacterium]